MSQTVIDTWMDFVEENSSKWPSDKIKKPWVKVKGNPVTFTSIAPMEVFLVHKYNNVSLKLTQLTKQYLDQESFKMAKDSTDTFRVIKLIGEKKSGAAAVLKHCLKYCEVDFSNKTCTVYFRASDIEKKLMTDIFYIQQKVLKPLGAETFTIICKIDEIMLRSPYWYIYLDAYADKYGVEAMVKRIEKMDNITKAWISYYQRHQGEINFRSLERARQKMFESKYWHIYSDYFEKQKSK